MGLIDRLLLFLYSLTIGLLTLLIMAQVFNYPVFDRFMLEYPYQMMIGAFLLFLVSLRFLFYRSSNQQAPQSIINKTEHGEVRISLQTLESLAERAARLVRGVNDLKTKVRPSEAGVRFAIRISVDPDLEIPQISTTVQQKVKDYVESTTGIMVQNVIVHVTDIAKPQAGKSAARPRVE